MKTATILGTHTQVDAYDVLEAFGVKCPATQNAVKLLLDPGHHGSVATSVSLAEARESLDRAIELQRKRNAPMAPPAAIAPQIPMT